MAYLPGETNPALRSSRMATALPRLKPCIRLGDQAFEVIREAILSGMYPAGQRLHLRPLAEQLGVSTMPVREALARLEELGLVRVVPYKGAIVTRGDTGDGSRPLRRAATASDQGSGHREEPRSAGSSATTSCST